MTSSRATRTLALPFLAIVLSSCGTRAPQRAPDALLVTIDTLRGDRWGCTGDPLARSPFADRLARQGTLAFEGRAAAPITLPSHTTIMTGLAPASHSVRDNGIFRLPAESGRTLAEAFRDTGYATAAFVSAFPLASKFGLDRGFTHYDDFLGGTEEEGPGGLPERRAPEVVARVRRYFEVGRAPGGEVPLFLWVHFFDPHAPYDPPHPWGRITGGDAYRAEVAFVDRELAALFAELDARRPSIPRRAVITSDHGESLGEHGEMTHGILVHAATIRVPILIWGGARQNALDSEPASLECVPRTLLVLAGRPDSLNADSASPIGKPGGGVLSETMYPWFNFGWRALRSWESDGWKLVQGETDRLYRIPEDPGETRDRSADSPEPLARLRDELSNDWTRRRATAYSEASSALSGEEFQALRTLGYAAGSGTSPATGEDTAFQTGPDPESRASLVDRVNLAITMRGDGDAEGACRVLNDLLERDPGNRLAWEELGGVELDRGNAAAARDAFLRALGLGRNPPWVPLYLADACRRLEDRVGERRALERALAADSLSVPARQRLFRLTIAEGDSAKALRYLEEAAAIRPRSVPIHMNLAEFFSARGDRVRAVEHWRRAAELDAEGPLGEKARAELAARGESAS